MKKNNIKDLNSALHYLSKCTGVVVWDTIFISIIIFFTACLIVFWSKCKRQAVIILILILAILLVVGHLIGTIKWRKRRFEDKAIKYSSKYFYINNTMQFIENIDTDIKHGNLLTTNLMLITDNYIIGRLSDITYEPVIIPKNIINEFQFYLLDTYPNHRNAHRIGILCCYLNNNQKVEYVICRALQAKQTLEQLQNYGINIVIKK